MHNDNNWLFKTDSCDFNTAVPNNQEGRLSTLASTTYYSKSKKEGKDQESIQSSTTSDRDTNGKVTNSQLDIANESQEVNPFPAGDHKALINRRARKHNKNKTEIT